MSYSKICDDLYHKEIFPKISNQSLFKLRLTCRGFKTITDKELAKRKHNIELSTENEAIPSFPFPVGTLTIRGKGTTLRTLVELLHKFKPNKLSIYGSVQKGPKLPKKIGKYIDPIDISYDGCYYFPVDSISGPIPNITSLSNLPRYRHNIDAITTFNLNDVVYFEKLKRLTLIQTNPNIDVNSVTKLANVTDSIVFKHRIRDSSYKTTKEELNSGSIFNISRIFNKSQAKSVSQELDIIRDVGTVSLEISIEPVERTSLDRNFELSFFNGSKNIMYDPSYHAISIVIRNPKMAQIDSTGYKIPNFRLIETGRVKLMYAYDAPTPITINKMAIIPCCNETKETEYYGAIFVCAVPYITIEHLNFIGARFSKRDSLEITVDEALEYEKEDRNTIFGTNISDHAVFGSKDEEKNGVVLNQCHAVIKILDIPFTERNISKNYRELKNVEVLNLYPIKYIIVSPLCFFEEYVKPELRRLIMDLECEVNIVYDGTTTLIKERTTLERPLKKQKTM